MNKKIITSIIIISLMLTSAQAKEIENKKNITKNIIIFNLNSNQKSKQYNYYSTIITHTISKDLGKNKEFNVTGNNQKIKKIKNFRSRRQVYNFLNNIKTFYLDYKKYDYILVGECNTVEDVNDEKTKTKKLKEILITIQIIDVKTKKAINFTEKSKEVGAIFQKTINNLSKQIKNSLVELEKKGSSSSVIKFHKVMSKVNIGIKCGRAFLVGEFENEFKDTVVIGPYLLIHPVKWFGISANFDYFSTSTEKTALSIDKSLIIYDSYLALHAIIPIKMFDFSFSGGIGATYTRIHINDPLTPMNPFSYSHSNKERIDYSLNAELSVNFNISIIRMNLGANYKAIFYKNEQLQILSVILGAGFRF